MKRPASPGNHDIAREAVSQKARRTVRMDMNATTAVSTSRPARDRSLVSPFRPVRSERCLLKLPPVEYARQYSTPGLSRDQDSDQNQEVSTAEDTLDADHLGHDIHFHGSLASSEDQDTAYNPQYQPSRQYDSCLKTIVDRTGSRQADQSPAENGNDCDLSPEPIDVCAEALEAYMNQREWWREVMLVARQHYTAYLSQAEPTEIIESALSVHLDRDVQEKFRKKLLRLFGQWKFRALKNARNWLAEHFPRVVKSAGIQLEPDCHDYNVLSDILDNHFRLEWVPLVFDWIRSYLDMDKVPLEGKRWLKCKCSIFHQANATIFSSHPNSVLSDAFIQVVVRERLAQLQETETFWHKLAAFKRKNFFVAYNNLPTWGEFQVSPCDFPLRSHRRKQPKRLAGEDSTKDPFGRPEQTDNGLF